MTHIKGMMELPESKIRLLYQTREKSLAWGLGAKKQRKMTSAKCQRVSTEMQSHFKTSLQAVILGKS